MSNPNDNIEDRGRMTGERDWQLVVDDSSTLRGFRRHGGGRTGVFIHGFRSHCDGQKARRLSEMAAKRGYDWLRFDQRGCGLSSGDFRCFTISAAINDLRRALDALGDRRYLLVGSSLGALLAMHAARADPRRIDGLVLIAPALRFTEHFLGRELGERDLGRWRRRGYRWFPDLYAGGCFRLDYSFCADALRYGEPPDKLPCPVRVVHGTRDELLPLQDTRTWLSRLECPASGLEIVDGGDHRLSEWTAVIIRQTETLWNETSHSCV